MSLTLGLDFGTTNSAIAAADDPPAMAAAFAAAVRAGRAARLAGLISPGDHPDPSSPLTAFL